MQGVQLYPTRSGIVRLAHGMTGYAREETGSIYGRLTVLSRAANQGEVAAWLCECTCGNRTVVRGDLLRGGKTQSCGCRRNKHGDSRSGQRPPHPLYVSWKSMKQRCADPKHVSFPNYGGRGITVCEEWSNSFSAYRGWIDENLGPRPDGFSLDRIDNEGNYEPGNLRWATAKEQANNRR